VVAVQEALVDVVDEEGEVAAGLLELAGMDQLVGDEGAVLVVRGGDEDAVAQGEAGGTGDAESGPAFKRGHQVAERVRDGIEREDADAFRVGDADAGGVPLTGAGEGDPEAQDPAFVVAGPNRRGEGKDIRHDTESESLHGSRAEWKAGAGSRPRPTGGGKT